MLHLKVSGDPRSRGRAHGEQFRMQIKELIHIRYALLRLYLKALHPMEIERLAYSQVEKLQMTDSLFEEFCGIAEAANVSLVELMILNNYTDMRDFSQDDQEEKTSEEGCTVFSLKNARDHFCGQTWDMHGSATPYMLHLEVDDSPKAHILTVTGCLALAGINEHSVGVMINNMHCSETQIGFQWPALVRGMLQQNKAGKALEYIKDHFPSSGHNYLICDPDEAINLETTGRRSQITYRRKENGFTCHTNHYLSTLREIEILKRQSKSTQPRLDAMKSILATESAPGKEVDANSFAQTVFNNPILSLPRSPDSPHAGATCGGCFFQLAKKSGFFYSGSYSENKIRPLTW